AVLGVTSLFIDWRSTAASFWHEVVPFDAAKVVVVSRFELYFRVTARERARGGKALRLTLERTDAFPRDEAAVQAARAATRPLPTGRRLAPGALARGHGRAEVFAGDGTFLRFADLRVAGLREEPRIVVEIPVRRDPRPARVVLTY
ncbi:MAG: hypothetical protein ACC662_05210, partial [Planctomycetota bacterium]